MADSNPTISMMVVASISPQKISPSEPKPTFTLFPKLPTELRHKIIRYSLPGPRLVHLYFKKGDFSYENGAISPMISEVEFPVMLHVCRESRQETLKSYQLQFGLGPNPPTVYFNFAIDTLQFGPIADCDRDHPNDGTEYIGGGEDELQLFMNTTNTKLWVKFSLWTLIQALGGVIGEV